MLEIQPTNLITQREQQNKQKKYRNSRKREGKKACW